VDDAKKVSALASAGPKLVPPLAVSAEIRAMASAAFSGAYNVDVD
jgi:hypothetical protein